MSPLSESTVSAANSGTTGTRELSAWQVAPGVTWIQARSPQFVRKLSQRSDSRLVATGVAGGYLRIYEFPHRLSWARRLIARYTATVTQTNARFLAAAARQGDFVCQSDSPCPRAGTGQNKAGKGTHAVVPIGSVRPDGKLNH